MVLPRFFSIRLLPGHKQIQTCGETRKETDMSICVGDTERKWAFIHFLSFPSHSFKTFPSMLASGYLAPWSFCSFLSPCRINASPIFPPQSLSALVFLLLLSNCHFARLTSPATRVCVCVFGLHSPCLNTHLQAIIKWLESPGVCVRGVEVGWCAAMPRSPWEFNYIPTPCHYKAQAYTHAHSHNKHTHVCVLSRITDSPAQRELARWDRSPDGRYWISQMCCNALKGHGENECHWHHTTKQVYLFVCLSAGRLERDGQTKMTPQWKKVKQKPCW